MRLATLVLLPPSIVGLNPTMLAACEAVLALSPIERVAVARRLRESVSREPFAGVDEMVRAALAKELPE